MAAQPLAQPPGRAATDLENLETHHNVAAVTQNLAAGALKAENRYPEPDRLHSHTNTDEILFWFNRVKAILKTTYQTIYALKNFDAPELAPVIDVLQAQL
ncbi:hypothetical protein Vafri_925 [Volvox africanus]|nr:hypothetical protein Vafri_925 [Volvox africanus]